MQVVNPYIEYRDDRWHGEHFGKDSFGAIGAIKNAMETIAPSSGFHFLTTCLTFKSKITVSCTFEDWQLWNVLPMVVRYA